MKSILLKSLAILLFLGGITSFVSYRMGLFDDQISNAMQRSPNGSNLNQNPPDSNQVDSTYQIEIMPSSKSIIMHEPSIIDTSRNEEPKYIMHSTKSAGPDHGLFMRQNKNENEPTFLDTNRKERMQIMGSSKSIRMIEHKPDTNRRKK